MQEGAQEAARVLAGIDVTIIIMYMAGVFFLGSYFGKYVKSAGDFFVAGRALPFWAIGMSLVVSDIAATDFIAVAGSAYTDGISVANFDWIGSMPAMAFGAFIFVPYFWRAGVYTIQEWLGRRYNTAVQVLHAICWGSFMLINLGLMLWIAGDELMHTILGWNPYVVIWLMVAVTGIYTFSGGLSAVVMTDVIQLIVMFVGGIALLALSLWEIGGWQALQEKVLAMGPEYQEHFTILLPHDTDTPYPWTGIVLGLGVVMAMGYWGGNQAIIQRTLGARSEWDAKGGMLFGALLKSFIPLMVAIPGLCAIIIVPGLTEGDRAIPEMIKVLMPPGLKGLMFVALFAAMMSSVDSYLSSVATIWTNDLYGRLVQLVTKRPLSERHGLYMGRGFTLVAIIFAGFLAPWVGQAESVYVFFQTVLSMIQGPSLAILLLGILWKRANRWGALAGLFLGVAFTTILTNVEGLFPSDDPFLFVAWWSFVFSLAVTVVVSLITPREPDDKIRGLVWGQVMKDGEIQRVLRKRIS